jgi:hypothetical protein
MKRYILDEVATFEEASVDPNYQEQDFRYKIDFLGNFSTANYRTSSTSDTWLRLTVLKGVL